MNERMASQLERVIQTSLEPLSRAFRRSHPSFPRRATETRVSTEAGFKAFAEEVTELKAWINDALSDTQHAAHAGWEAFNECSYRRVIDDVGSTGHSAVHNVFACEFFQVLQTMMDVFFSLSVHSVYVRQCALLSGY